MFKKILIFLVGTGISYLLIMFRRQINDFTGDIPFAEKYFGSTLTFFVVLAIIVFVITIMYVFGSLDSVLQGVFGRLF